MAIEINEQIEELLLMSLTNRDQISHTTGRWSTLDQQSPAWLISYVGVFPCYRENSLFASFFKENRQVRFRPAWVDGGKVNNVQKRFTCMWDRTPSCRSHSYSRRRHSTLFKILPRGLNIISAGSGGCRNRTRYLVVSAIVLTKCVKSQQVCSTNFSFILVSTYSNQYMKQIQILLPVLRYYSQYIFKVPLYIKKVWKQIVFIRDLKWDYLSQLLACHSCMYKTTILLSLL